MINEEQIVLGRKFGLRGLLLRFLNFKFLGDRGQEPLRIDKFLMNRIEGATRNKLQQAINVGLVLVNGKQVRPNYRVRSLDEIILYSDMSPEETEVVPENI